MSVTTMFGKLPSDVLANLDHLITIVVCALTSNLKRAVATGNVLLAPGEANLQSKALSIFRRYSRCLKQIWGNTSGRLSRRRIDQILDGIKLLIEPRDIDPSDADPMSGAEFNTIENTDAKYQVHAQCSESGFCQRE